MKRIIAAAVLAFAFASQSAPSFADEPKQSYVPKEGFVPTAEVAISIAVAVLEPIYGAAKIAAEKPFTAKLNNGVWTVEGSLPKGAPGGVAVAEISKADGRVLRVIHSQ